MLSKKRLINLSSEQNAYLEQYSKRHGESVSAVVRMLTVNWIEGRELEKAESQVKYLNGKMIDLEAEIAKLKIAQNRIESKLPPVYKD